MEAHALDVVEVHRNAGDVAREPHPRAVRGDADVLADVGAEEIEQVFAALALDDVAVVTRAPDEAVVAVAEQRAVVAVSTGDDVVALPADQKSQRRCRRAACRPRRLR